MTGAEIDRPRNLAVTFFAAQAGENFREGEIAVPFGEQLHRAALAAACGMMPREKYAFFLKLRSKIA
jgi:hypothetical protein